MTVSSVGAARWAPVDDNGEEADNYAADAGTNGAGHDVAGPRIKLLVAATVVRDTLIAFMLLAARVKDRRAGR
jgi:hypothetical protein